MSDSNRHKAFEIHCSCGFSMSCTIIGEVVAADEVLDAVSSEWLMRVEQLERDILAQHTGDGHEPVLLSQARLARELMDTTQSMTIRHNVRRDEDHIL